MSVGSTETVTDAASVHADLARISELRCESTSPVRKQHVVSAVVLKRFAVPRPGGVKLSRIDVDHPGRPQKDKGPRGFGWVEDFVPFASGSMEDLWKETETLLPKAFEALDAGEALTDPQAKKVLLDTVALHFVRSLRIRAMHEDIWAQVFAAHYHRMVTTGAERVRSATLNEYNLHLAGPEGVEYFANRFLTLSKSIYESGALLRTGLEERFQLARRRVAGSGVQIITPHEGEFLIGDSPALSLRYTMPPGGAIIGVPLGDANTVVLPLGPHHMIALGPIDETIKISKDVVDGMNRLQIQASQTYVHFRPGSALPRFVYSMCAAGQRTAVPVSSYGPSPEVVRR